MDIKELLTGVLSKTLNMDDQGVASLYNEDGSVKDDAMATILNLDAARIKTLKDENASERVAQYNRGKKEALEGLESELRDEHGIKDANLKGKALVKAIIVAKAGTEPEKEKAEKLTDDDVKKHPLFLKMEADAKAQVDKLTADYDKKIADQETSFNREKTLSSVVSDAEAIFDGLKPVLSKDPTRAKNQKKLFLDEIAALDYEVGASQAGKRSILALKEGKRLEDEHGHPVAFERLVRTIAEKYYDFEASEGRSTAGDPNKDKDTKDRGSSTVRPKTFADYSKEFHRIETTVKDKSEQVKMWADLREAAKEEGLEV